MGTNISSMMFLTDRTVIVSFPGRPEENDHDWVSGPPSCGIDEGNGTDGQATGEIRRSHSTLREAYKHRFLIREMSLVHICAFLIGCCSFCAMVYSSYMRSTRIRVGYCLARMNNG